MSTDLATASNPPADPPKPRDRGDRGPFVISMIGLAALLFVCTEGLLYYRWATMIEPTHVLIVETSELLKGAEITVSGVTIQPYKVTVGAGGRYAIPFYVEPGHYSIKVTQNDQSLFEAEVDLGPRETGKRFDLTKLAPAPSQASSTQPALPTFP
jgi:hypothetical protein